MVFGGDPAEKLKQCGIHIGTKSHRDQVERRGVTDLITQNLCARHAHFFGEGQYPTNTPIALMGLLLHRTIKDLHGRYLVAQRLGDDWIPNTQAVLEEYQIAEEAARTQGLPKLYPEQGERLRQMLCTFHDIEAKWFYPRIQQAEVSLSWRWEEAPGGPVLLEGKVDVVLLHPEGGSPRIAIWDYKTGKQPPPGSTELRAYQQQMKLYAFLYRQRFQAPPDGTALYFMQELAGKNPPTTRPTKALYEVSITRDDDDDVLEWLFDVLSQERACKEQNQWNPPAPGEIPQRLCQSCGVRWSCPSYRAPFPWDIAGKQEEAEEVLEF